MHDPLRAPPRKKNKAKQATLMRQIGKGLVRKPAVTALTLVFGALSAVTVVNALALQTDRHPGILFSTVGANKIVSANKPQTLAALQTSLQSPRPSNGFSIAMTPTDAAKPTFGVADPSILVKDLQSELAERGFYTGTIDGVKGQQTEAAIRSFEVKIGLPATGEASALLLRHIATANPATTKPATTDTADVEPTDDLASLIQAATPADPAESQRVAKVQTLLNQLSYGPLTADGVFGSATKNAIERFERDKKRPIRGEADGALLKALASSAKIALE